jgi:hypothetical protein
MIKFCFFLLFLAEPIWAGAAQAQNPDTLGSARSACIKLLHGSARDAASAKAELRKWGRFKLVDDCAKADISLWIAAGSPAKEHVCHVTVQAIAPNQQLLWSQSRDCKGTTPPVVAQLVRRLRADLSAKKK